jgi:8-oxo-dGTP pyrophosphatase MutT (NUDIX family)
MTQPLPRAASKGPKLVTCGTLVVNAHGQLLLCHVTNTAKWDIPKGLIDPGETPLQAAMRELFEEAGLMFEAGRFEDLGLFDYRPDKRLYLFRVRSGTELTSLDHLCCTSYFPHPVTGKPTPETDGFRWAGRSEIADLCWPNMARRLLQLDW